MEIIYPLFVQNAGILVNFCTIRGSRDVGIWNAVTGQPRGRVVSIPTYCTPLRGPVLTEPEYPLTTTAATETRVQTYLRDARWVFAQHSL